MSRHRTPEVWTAGRHRKNGRASRWATWWRLLTGESPQRTPVMPAALLLDQLARAPHPARGVIPTYPYPTFQEAS